MAVFIYDPDPTPTITKREAVAAGTSRALGRTGHLSRCPDIVYGRGKCYLEPARWEQIIEIALRLSNKFLARGFIDE